MSECNVVGSSGWIEYFADGSNADFFEAAIENAELLIVPSTSIYKVFKRLLAEPDGEEKGLRVAAMMQRGQVIELRGELALEAARVSRENKMPMAGSIILAMAREHGATLWTQDSDFESIEGVRYRKRTVKRCAFVAPNLQPRYPECMAEKTLFQKIMDREIPGDIIHEDEQCIAIRDINPQAPTHALVIPRKPIPSLDALTEEDEPLVGRLFTVAKEIAAAEGLSNGYRTVFNTGPHGQQTVEHIHLHVIGGRQMSWPPG